MHTKTKEAKKLNRPGPLYSFGLFVFFMHVLEPNLICLSLCMFLELRALKTDLFANACAVFSTSKLQNVHRDETMQVLTPKKVAFVCRFHFKAPGQQTKMLTAKRKPQENSGPGPLDSFTCSVLFGSRCMSWSKLLFAWPCACSGALVLQVLPSQSAHVLC